MTVPADPKSNQELTGSSEALAKTQAMVDELLSYWDQDEFFAVIAEASREQAAREKTIPDALVRINNNTSHDVCRQFLRLSLDRGNWWVRLAFFNALPCLNAPAAHVAETILHLVSLGGRNGEGYGGFWGALISYSTTHQADALELLRLISDNKGAYTALFCPVLSGASKHSFREAHATALALSSSPCDDLRAKALFGLSLLDYDGRNAELEQTIECYLATEHDDQVECLLVRSLGRLLSWGDDRVLACLVRFSRRQQTDVLLELADVLFHNASRCQEAWFSEILEGLSRVPVDSLENTNSLDCIVVEMLTHDADIAQTFIERWLVKQESGDILSRYFRGYIHAVLSDDRRVVLSRTLTRWYSSQSRCLHEAAGAIVDEFAMNKEGFLKFEQISFDAELLASMSHCELVYLIKKMFGFSFLHAQEMCWLLFSILKTKRDTDWIDQLVFRFFIEVLGFSYPSVVIEFMKERENDTSGNEKELAWAVLGAVRCQMDRLESLDRLKEWRAPVDRLTKYRAACGRRTCDALENARDSHDSLLDAICQRVQLKCGKKSFTKMPKQIAAEQCKFTPSSELKEFSSTISQARWPELDPVDFDFTLLMWRSESQDPQDDEACHS